MNKTAVIYARVSSIGDRQDTTRQVSDLQTIAIERNLSVEKVFEEKASGAKSVNERPILQECLNYAAINRINTILVSELSRLGRNVDDVLTNVKYCKDNHINVYFQKEQLSIFNENGNEHPFLTIFIAVLGTCAQIERDNIKFRLNSGRQQFIKNGGKLGRKEGYRKPIEQMKEDYKNVIRLLRKGMAVRDIAKIESISKTTVMKVKQIFIDDAK